MIAVKNKNLDVAETLIQSFRFKVNEKINDKSAIDVAFFKKDYAMIKMLLLNNSMYPKNIEKVKNVGIKNIIRTSLNLHELIVKHNENNSQIENITEILNQNSTLKHFFNLKNQSAAFNAIKNQKLDIYELLASKYIVIGPNERISETVNTFEVFEKVRKINDKYAKKHYLNNLINKSFPALNDPDFCYRMDLIIEAYKFLDEIPQISPYLELVSNSGKFDIFFDFNSDTTEYFVSGSDARGMYNDSTIYIAAKKLLNEKTMLEVIGVLAHELCHYAMYLVYRNGKKPYAVGDEPAEKEFAKILNECELNKEKEDIIKRVFDYTKDKWEFELIVRVPQMLVHYLYDIGKLKYLRDTYASLFKNFEDVVLPHVRATTSVIKKITDSPKSIKWKDLTPQLQQAIKFRDISLVGKKYKFCRIYGNDYNRLPSQRIILLLQKKVITVKEFKNDIKYFVKNSLLPNYKGDARAKKFIKNVIEPSQQVTPNSLIAGVGAMSSAKTPDSRMWIQFFDLKEKFEHKNEGFNYTDSVGSFLNTFDLSQFVKRGIHKFLVKYFRDMNLNQNEQNFKTNVTKKFIAGIKEGRCWSRWRGKTILNPLILLLIAEYDIIDQEIKLNLYAIVESFVNKKLKVIGEEDREQGELELLNKIEVHQVFALVLYYGKEETSNLEIMKKKNKWLYNDINSIKILYVESEEKFTFDHRIFAEYFCAVYFIDGIFNCKDQLNKEEANLRLELLMSSTTKWQPKVRSLILNYLDLNSKDDSNDFIKIYEQLLLNEHKAILTKHSDKSSIYMILFLSRFFQKNQTIMKTIWNLTGDKNFLLSSMRQHHMLEITKIIEPLLSLKDKEIFFNVYNRNEFFFYSLWSNINYYNESLLRLNKFVRNLLELSKMDDENLPHRKSLTDFLQLISVILGKGSKIKKAKETRKEIFPNNKEQKQLKIGQTEYLTRDDISNLLSAEISKSERNVMILTMFLNIKEDNFYDFFFTMIEKCVENSKIYDILLKPPELNENFSLISIIMINNDKLFKSFSTFFEKNFNRYVKKKILMHRNADAQTALNFLIVNEYSNIEKIVVDTYCKHFSHDELIEILKTDLKHESMLIGVIINDKFSLPQAEKLLNFVVNLISEKEEEILNFLCYEKHEIQRNVQNFRFKKKYSSKNVSDKVEYFQDYFKKYENKNNMYKHGVLSILEENNSDLE